MSGLTIISMLMVSQGIIWVSADNPAPAPAPSIARNLAVKFMGRGDTPQDVSPGKAQLNAEDKTGQTEFWVGVLVDKVHDLTLFTNGVYSLEVAFEYDPAFITPYYTSNDAEGDWKSALEKGNLSTENNTAWWNSGQYEIMSVVDTDIDIETDYGDAVDREAADVAQQRKDDGWRMCVVCVNFKDSVFENARFKDLSDEGEQCLIKLPFKVINVPAETATNKDPTVLSLVRGPETFNIGAGEKGKTPHSTWEATVTDWSDTENMKTLFRDNGDISLFGKGGSIEDIQPFKPKTGDETSDTPYTLSNTDQLEADGFTAEQKTYYLRVPNETEKIKLNITASENPEVKIAYSDTAGETTINSASSGEKQFTTDEITLKELNKDTANGGTANGYNNTVTVSSGDTTYTIYIQRLLKPKIVLNPGNSPYGEMERMAAKYLPADKQDQAWDEAKIQKAKEEFNKAHKYADGYIPDGLSDKTSIIYTADAWIGSGYNRVTNSILPTSPEELAKMKDPEINLDRNNTVIFAYQDKAFADTGFTAINSLGEDVTDKVIRSIEIKRVRNYNIDYIPILTGVDKDVEEIEFPANSNDDLSKISAGKKVSGEKDPRLVRPGKYELNYIFEDIDGNNIEPVVRYIVVLPEFGNTNMKDNVDTNDTIAIYAHDKGTKPIVGFYRITQSAYKK